MFSTESKKHPKIINSKEYQAIFKESLPHKIFLEDIIIRELSLTLRLYFPITGMTYPEAWSKKGYDHASMDAYVQGAKNITIDALSREAELDIQIVEGEIEIKNPLGFSMRARFEEIITGNIKGFLLCK